MSILANRRILVTGVLNRFSIAYAIAKAVQQHGGELALTYQSSDRLRNKVGKLAREDFDGVPLFPLDVASDEQCDATIDQVDKLWGGLDGLVHAVAFAPREALDGSFHEVTSREAFATALDISAYSLTALAKSSARLLGPGGSIVTMTYLGSVRAVPNYNVMGVAKAALESSVRYLAGSMGPQGVRVNAISAGPIKTLAAAGIAGINTMLKEVASQSALQRNISQDEVGQTAAFLLSDMASGITGETLYVDAGHNVMLGRPASSAGS